MRFLVYLYYTQPFYQTPTFGQNHAYCIQIFTVVEDHHTATENHMPYGIIAVLFATQHR